MSRRPIDAQPEQRQTGRATTGQKMKAASMPRQYGKFPQQNRRGPAAPQASEIQINITGRHTVEQLALELQRAIALLQDHGIEGVQAFRARLMPLDEIAAPMIVRGEQGQQITAINIPEVPAEKPYRENEPGLGVLPVQRGAMRRDAQHPGQSQPEPSSYSSPAAAKPLRRE